MVLLRKYKVSFKKSADLNTGAKESLENGTLQPILPRVFIKGVINSDWQYHAQTKPKPCCLICKILEVVHDLQENAQAPTKHPWKCWWACLCVSGDVVLAVVACQGDGSVAQLGGYHQLSGHRGRGLVGGTHVWKSAKTGFKHHSTSFVTWTGSSPKILKTFGTEEPSVCASKTP